MNILSHIYSYIDRSQSKFLSELSDLLALKSISTDPDYAPDIRQCAQHLSQHFQSMGMQDTTVIETQQHPIVVSRYHVSDSLPTLLIYGHYDVQPPDPLDLWVSDPFIASIRGDYIFARGVSDDKGQFFCHMKAVESWLHTTQTLPVNVIFLIEGEEEIGSPHLADTLRGHLSLFQADVAVISDTPMISKNQPALCCSLRGLLYTELEIIGPNRDLHSGQYGGFIQNPIHALSTLIAALKDDHDHILIPGFYDDVIPPSHQELSHFHSFPDDADHIKTDLQLSSFIGDPQKSLREKMWCSPTLDCNGIVGGYTQPGAKTIIPSQASAKISMRLVANQNPHTLFASFKQYLHSLIPPGVSLSVSSHTAAFPAKMITDSVYMKAAENAFESVYHTPPVFVGEGGTIPVVADFKQILNLDTVMMGFNCPDDCIHSPNERMRLDGFFNGIKTSATFMHYLQHTAS